MKKEPSETHWLVQETGEIGQVVPSPCDNPIILEFKCGVRDAFFLKELSPTAAELTHASPIRVSHAKKNNYRSRPKGPERETIRRMIRIINFLKKVKEPIARSHIERALGFNCVRPMMKQESQKHFPSLESMGIVKRYPDCRKWVKWKLTEKGRTEGIRIVNSLWLNQD